MNQIPYLSPGCFGSALNFQATNMVCAACPFKDECEPAHLISLQAMRDRLGIKAPASKAKTKVTKPEQVEVSNDSADRMTLPKKVRELLTRLDRSNFNIVQKMRSGVNPFSGHKQHRFMLVACHMIIKAKTPVNHKMIAAGMASSLDWAPGTADAHARMAIQALSYVGAITTENGFITIRGE